MRIGIFGSPEDLQCQAVARELEVLGARPVIVDADSLSRGVPCSFEGTRSFHDGQRIDDIGAFYLRFIPAPYAPAVEEDGERVLHQDWFNGYMQERERASFYVAWLLNLVESGATLVNPPQAASVLQYKPLQLHALKLLGAPTPRTLITNDPARVKAFRTLVKEVIYKPLMGGAITRLLDDAALGKLDLIRRAPVIFQERIRGEDVRVMLVAGKVVSSVAIEVDALDFRDDETYASGRAGYHEVPLPEQIERWCVEAAKRCGLSFAGIDLKHHRGRWVFLELNSSPVYLDVELKLGHRISGAIARHLVTSAKWRTPARKPRNRTGRRANPE